MPTLLDLVGVECPDTCTGRSLVSEPHREHLYCEALEGPLSMRMVVEEDWKLIWYPAGNAFQLFNRISDPDETRNLANNVKHKDVQDRLTEVLKSELYGEDVAWVKDGELIGIPAPEVSKGPNRGLWSQRGLHYPQPPAGLNQKPLGAPS
jgi:arylsulfatase A-like enzyme